ncbi:MAG: fibrobacter succinogenes major paralogous domain-containing protein [Fibromonadaceae bacterium]|jgi:uncharacterized protein (TIGR02145 family)|nr:fibrobacter succinogenes major paralogous domain-containing protein [Fibromonadaceae bacterium]
MKKLLAILLVLCSVTFGQKPKLIISVSGELEKDLADVLMTQVSHNLSNYDTYEILINDMEFNETLKKEWEKGNVSDSTIIGLAKKAGANYLCFTKIKSVKGLKGKLVTAQVYDLANMTYTKQMGSETTEDEFSDLKDLTETISKVVAQMLGATKNNSSGGKSNNATNSNVANSSNSVKSKIGDPFTDSRDGKQYKTVKIGEQIWMAENMNYKTGKFWCYNNENFNCEKYGLLYDWNTAMKVCPKGWKLPSRSEWNYLVQSIGKEFAGKKLKSINERGTDDFEFSALLGGRRNVGGSFNYLGENGRWWTSTTTLDSINNAYYQYMNKSNDHVDENLWYNDFSNGYSVRCIMGFPDTNMAKPTVAGINDNNASKKNDDILIDTRDSRQYKTVKIGNQTWMAENLNYQIAANSWCYDNNPNNCTKYGRLYSWNAASKACPSGWHLPSSAEWNKLVSTDGLTRTAGNKLKSKTGWKNNGGGTDVYGFSALPGGLRSGGNFAHRSNGQSISAGSFDCLGNCGYWWSATRNKVSSWGGSSYDSRAMYYHDDYVSEDTDNESSAFSVRCVKD